jgi:hypothetical protein
MAHDLPETGKRTLSNTDRYSRVSSHRNGLEAGVYPPPSLAPGEVVGERTPYYLTGEVLIFICEM